MKKRRQKKKTNKFLKLKIMGFVGFSFLISLVALYFSPLGKDVQKIGKNIVESCAQKAHFNLERVVVEGHIRTKLNDLNAKLNLRQGMPIFEIDLEKEKQSVLADLADLAAFADANFNKRYGKNTDCCLAK